MVRVRGGHGEGRPEPRVGALTRQKCVCHAGASRGEFEGKAALRSGWIARAPLAQSEVLSEVTRACPPGIMYERSLDAARAAGRWYGVLASIARVTQSAQLPFSARIRRAASMSTPTGATATAAWPAVATRKGAAHLSDALTGSVRAPKIAVRADAVSGDRAGAAALACAAKQNMPLPEA
eukprot:2862979-Pleurochrysis_carterae.AAC.4